jgi:hypothetical protein
MRKPDRRRSILVYGIPLVAVLIVGVALYATYAQSQVALQQQFFLVIQLKKGDSTGNVVTTDIRLAGNIGASGGVMYTQKYLRYGINGNYPMHTVDSSGLVYIDSNIARSYTLGDFFEVWGFPLGINKTLTFSANYTASPPYYWDMCIRAGTSEIPDPSWGNHVIKDREIIDLIYSQLGCG